MDLRPLPFCAVLTAFILLACSKKAADKIETLNPPAPGFDLAYSDPAAVELADSIMAAMGGRQAWDDTRYIIWQPAPGRKIQWDKNAGRIRVENNADSTIVLLNTRNGSGRIKTSRGEITQPDSLRKKLRHARNLWNNDSLWLVLPFNLKGPGLILRYLGEDTLLVNGDKCNLLEASLRQTQNKERYLLFVDLKDNLVKQWAYSKNGPQENPEFIRPWDNYKKYGSLRLSADRSDRSGPRDVHIVEQLPVNTFTEF